MLEDIIKGIAQKPYKMGDKVLYQGEEWEVGFVNQLHWAGSLRLQKSGMADARQVNHVYPEDVIKLDDCKVLQRSEVRE